MNNNKKIATNKLSKILWYSVGSVPPPPGYEQAEDQVGLLSVRSNKTEGKLLETKK